MLYFVMLIVCFLWGYSATTSILGGGRDLKQVLLFLGTTLLLVIYYGCV